MLVCEHCGIENDSVKPTPAATAYYWNGEGEDPNRDVVFCEECRSEYYDHWNEIWHVYYTSVIC